jgi:beta-lactamase regulating signal transducer with metallopeptidase domain
MNLTALQHSAFLQSLGWAIANSLWQGAILWSIYLLVNSIHKNASSAFKTNSGTASLFLLFAWFVVTFLQKFTTVVDEPGVTPTAGPLSIHLSGTSSVLNWHKIVEGILNTLPYLSVAYLFLLVLLALRLFNSYRHIYYIKQNGLHKAGVEWRLFAERVATHIGITKKISIWLSDHVDVPATIGFIKPVILIPVASINQLSVAQLEAIILHELSHIKRNDYLLNLFISLIETILFFNPFVVLLCKIIKKERENSCDDFVIQYQYDRHSYASALLSLEQSRMQHLRLALTATSGKKQLLHRIQRIMEVNNRNAGFNYGQKLIALLLVTGIICSLAWLSPEKKENIQSNQRTYHIVPAKVIKAEPVKQEVITASNPVSKTITSTVKSKKTTPVIDNTDDLENTEIASGENNSDDPPPLTQDNTYGPAAAPGNGNGFFNADQLQEFKTYQQPRQGFKKNQVFRIQPHTFNNQIFRTPPAKLDIEKLKSALNNAHLAFTWRNIEDAIADNWENIEWLTQDETQQKQILEKIEKLVLQETEKNTERKVLRDRIRKIESSNLEVARLNRQLASLVDTGYATALDLYKGSSQKAFYEMPQGKVIYTPSPSEPVMTNKKGPKQKSDRFEFRYNIDRDIPCNDKKHLPKDCPKKFTMNYANGMVFINGKKINIPELNSLRELDLKKLTIDAQKQHLDIMINN